MRTERMRLADKINLIVNHVKERSAEEGTTLNESEQSTLKEIDSAAVKVRSRGTAEQTAILAQTFERIEKALLLDHPVTYGAGLRSIKKELDFELGYSHDAITNRQQGELSEIERRLNDRLENAESVGIDELEEQILTMYRQDHISAFHFLMDFIKGVHSQLTVDPSGEIEGGTG